MNPVRTTLALAVLLPVSLGAAEAPPPADRPFATAREDLGALKSATPGAVPGAGFDLGAAAGISGSGNFGAPPPVSAPARPPESAPTNQPAKSSGWLLDALEENSRKAGTGGSQNGSLGDPAPADDKEQNDRTPGTSKTATRQPTSTLPSAVNSPLSGYMSVWLSPDEFRRLGNLYPELVGGGAQTDAQADPSALRRLDGASATAKASSVQDVAQFTSGGTGSSQTPVNPFIQAMQPVAPRTVNPVSPGGPPRVSAAPPASLAAPAPEVAKPPPVLPPAPGADDRRYFPQLKRF